MKKYSIGYRLKFNYINPEDIEKFITDYLKLFDRFEIKINKNLISSEKLELILNVSEKVASGKYSIHIYKDVLENDETYRDMVQLISILSNFKISNKVYLITHIPYGDCLNYLSKILKISRILPKNYILLLENIDLENNNTSYLKQINNICVILEENNIENIGICLDIGHLLYGCNREKISEISVLSKIQKMPTFLSKIKEIHIHDYIEQDHLQLKSGVMNLEVVSEFIKANRLNVPIIIEATVKLPEDDGIKQIKIMEELLSES